MAEKLYEHSGAILKTVLAKKGSIKSLCFSSQYRNKKKLYALTFESLKRKYF